MTLMREMSESCHYILIVSRKFISIRMGSPTSMHTSSADGHFIARKKTK